MAIFPWTFPVTLNSDITGVRNCLAGIISDRVSDDIITDKIADATAYINKIKSSSASTTNVNIAIKYKAAELVYTFYALTNEYSTPDINYLADKIQEKAQEFIDMIVDTTVGASIYLPSMGLTYNNDYIDYLNGDD